MARLRLATRSMKTTLIITALVIVALVAAFVALRAGSANDEASQSLPLQPKSEWEAAVAAKEKSAPLGFVAWNAADAERRIKTGAAELPSLDEEAERKLTESATTILDAYWNSNPKKFMDHYESLGLANVLSHLDGGARQDQMDKRTRSVKYAPVSLDRMKVQWFIRDGKRVDDERPKDWQVSAVAAGSTRGPDDIIDPEQPGFDVVTVSMPAQMLDALTGEPFTGDFFLYFARRTGETRWVPFRVESRNRLAVPPLDTPNPPKIYFPPI